MTTHSRTFKAVAGLVIILMIGLSVPLPSFAQETAPPIELKKGFFKPLKFTFGEGKPRSVYNFSGLSFKKPFEETIGLYPPALEQARRARFYNGLALTGVLGLLVFSFKMLLDTIDDANKVSKGIMVDDSFNFNELIPFFVCGTATVVGAVMSSAQLSHAVELFNQNRRQIEWPQGRQGLFISPDADRSARWNLEIGLAGFRAHTPGRTGTDPGLSVCLIYGGF
jgi:hypothetical protein